MRGVAVLLNFAYFLGLLYVIAKAVQMAQRDRSFRAFRPLAATLLSASLLRFAINFIYARAAAAQWVVSQVLLSTVFIAAVLCVLKALDGGLQRLANGLVVRVFRRPASARNTRNIALLIRLVVLFAVGLPYVMAVAMVYRPKVVGENPTQQFGLPYESVTFETREKDVLGIERSIKLAGWWIEANESSPNARRTILLCHGLGASKANQLPMAEHLIRAGYNVLAFDFRAHGESGGQVTTFGDTERRDVLAAVAWLRRARPGQSQQIFGVGASMGAAALIAAAGKPAEEGQAISAVVVYGTYDDLGDLTRTMCDKHFPKPLNWLGRYLAVPIASAHAGSNLKTFVPADALDRLAGRPLLVIHGTDDEIIAFDHGRHLFERARAPKQSLWIPGDHNSVLMSSEAAKAVREFLEKVGSW